MNRTIFTISSLKGIQQLGFQQRNNAEFVQTLQLGGSCLSEVLLGVYDYRDFVCLIQ